MIPEAYKSFLSGERPVRRSLALPYVQTRTVSVRHKQPEYECVRCKRKYPHGDRSFQRSYCLGCSKQVSSIAGKARALTREAVKAGLLPDPTTLKCTDCHKPATVYDHRSYAVALKVEAVCDSCNWKRGPASWETEHTQPPSSATLATPASAGNGRDSEHTVGQTPVSPAVDEWGAG